MPLEPPPVTVVDPSLPPGTADLLESQHEKWRPRRWQVVVAGLLVVTGVASAWEQHARSERAKDRASVQAVDVDVEWESSTGGAANTVALLVKNIATSPVTVGLLRVPGFAPVHVGRLGASGSSVQLTDHRPCSPALLDQTNGAASADVTTVRGARARVSLPVSAYAWQGIWWEVAERCGYLGPSQAFRADVISARAARHQVTLVLDVHDDSVLPLLLQALSGPFGTTLTPSAALPLALHRQPRPGAPSPGTRLTVVLRVSSCADLLVSGGDLALQATVTRGSAVLVSSIPLVPDVGGLRTTSGADARDLLVTACRR